MTIKSSHQEWTVSVGDAETTALYDPADADTDTVLVLAHGAGGSMLDRSMLALSRALNDKGLSVVRFNFLYRARGSGRPDPMPKLEETFTAVVERVRSELSPKKLVIGGRSMGGRAGSMLASKGFDCDGLALFAYPLHPPGHPEKLRDAHLPSIEVPVICFSGTRDPFISQDLMEKVLKNVKTKWDMQWLEAADHSFHVPKSSGRSDAELLEEVAAKTKEWVNALD